MRVLKNPLTLLGKMNLIKPGAKEEDDTVSEEDSSLLDFEAPPSLGGSTITVPPPHAIGKSEQHPSTDESGEERLAKKIAETVVGDGEFQWSKITPEMRPPLDFILLNGTCILIHSSMPFFLSM